MKYRGIDIGTTNSLIAEVTVSNGKAEVKCLADKSGRTSFPSVVHYVERNKFIFGVGAREKLLTAPDSTVSLIKTRLGKVTDVPVTIGSQVHNISPQEISATILRQMAVGFGDEISRAVVTKPANYSHNQNFALKEIADIAGIDIIEMIEEPSAAVMYHIFKEYQGGRINISDYAQPRNIMVFDFGGGTLDLSIVSVVAQGDLLSTKVLWNGGDTDLGGARIDLTFAEQAIKALHGRNKDDEFLESVKYEFAYYYETFLKNESLRFRNGATIEQKKFIVSLMQELERVKIKLSSETKAEIVMPGYNGVKITREQFESKVLKYGDDSILDMLNEVLRKAKNFLGDDKSVYQFILVGGSSNIPFIRGVVKEALNENGVPDSKFIVSDDYGTAIVKGAALLAAIRHESIVPFSKKACKTIVSKRIELDNMGEIIVVANIGEEYPFVSSKECRLKIKNSLSADIQLKFFEVSVTADNRESRKEVLAFNFFLPIYYTGDDLILLFDITQDGLYNIILAHSQSKDLIGYKQKVTNELTDMQKEQARLMIKGSANG